MIYNFTLLLGPKTTLCSVIPMLMKDALTDLSVHPALVAALLSLLPGSRRAKMLDW